MADKDSTALPPPPPPPPSFPPPPPAANPEGSGDGAERKSPVWRKRLLIAAGLLVALSVLGALVGDEEEVGTENPSQATEQVQRADADEAVPSSSEEVESDGSSSEPPSTTTTTTSTTTTTLAFSGGTRSNPWGYGVPTPVTLETFGDADGSLWAITVGEPQDVTSAVLDENIFNDAPPEGFLFVGFEVSAQLLDAKKVPLSPGFNFSWEILGGSSSKVFDESSIEDIFGCGVTPSEFNDFAEVYAGGTLSGLVCIPLPAEDFNDPATQVAINMTGGDRVIFGLDGEPAPAPPPPNLDETVATSEGAGTRSAPFPYGKGTEVVFESYGDADGSVWSVIISRPSDITRLVQDENLFNDPPPEGFIFAGFDVELTLLSTDKEPLSTGFNLTWEILGGSTNAVFGEYGVSGSCGVTPNEFDSFTEVFVGGTLSGTVCMPLPIADLDAVGTQVAINFTASDRVVFG